MPFTKYAVETFISKEAAAITRCGASDLRAKVPDFDHWLTNYGLAVLFNDFPPAQLRPLAIDIIRRIHAAFFQYEIARNQVLTLVRDGHGRWSPYFAALTGFEVVVSQHYVALDAVRKFTKQNLFQSGDKSVEDRLNKLYNASKHRVATDSLPVWFTNDGLVCADAEVLFSELESRMLECAGLVAGLCNPEKLHEIAKPAINGSA